MTQKTLLYLILEDLTKALGGVGVDVYLGRPKITSEEKNEFVVVDIPTEIHDRIAGGEGVMMGTYGRFTVYCKAKSDRTMNINRQSELVDKVFSLFPINGKHVTAKGPTILLQGEDGYGYQATDITFRLRTKFNVKFNQ